MIKLSREEQNIIKLLVEEEIKDLERVFNNKAANFVEEDIHKLMNCELKRVLNINKNLFEKLERSLNDETIINEDEALYEIVCPECDETIYVYEDDVEVGELTCNHCRYATIIL